MSVTPWRSLRRDERGTVMVLMAVAMFPFLFLAAYAIDVSHWWDYSRNLQNRADAAALAGATQYGNLCFAGNTPGNVTTGAQAKIGQFAQLYTGAGTGEPVGPNAQLFYTTGAVTTGTGWNVATNGYLNNTLNASPINSPLTLKLGNLNDFWVVLNGKNYSENGGTSFSMLTGGSGATFCNSDPTQDLTDPDRATAGAAGPMVDVKVSQKRLPLFFSLISGRPTLHAHARVQLQGEASTPTEPIAVSDNGFTPCVSVNLVNATTNTVIQTITLTRTSPVNQVGPVQWDNSAAPASFTMPASDNVYVQPFLNNCNGSGSLYDGDSNTGILMINNHPASAPTVNSGQPPQIGTGGVSVGGTGCTGTQYFANGACTVEVDANVVFAGDVTPASKAKVFVVQRTWDPVAGAYVNSAPAALSRPGTAGCPAASYCGNVAIGDSSGIDQFIITWEEDAGKIGTTDCSGNPTPAVCTGSFGVQAQSFGACNGCDQPDDSGPIVFARISVPGVGGGNDFNTIAGGATKNLVVTLQLAGLAAATYPSPPTVLRFPTSGNHQTGLVDCGQGNSLNGDSSVVFYGCGPGNPNFNPPLNPLFINTRNTCGTPPGPPWPNGNNQDCVQTTPGTRRTGIICPLVQRITSAPFGPPCNNNAAGTCPANEWTANNGNITDFTNKRAVTMIITSGADFGSVAGSPQGWLPIRRFATFYVTGWDSNIKPQCANNEAFPGRGKNTQNAAVWGHWINYVDATGIGNNQPCDLTSVQPINCVPVLTR